MNPPEYVHLAINNLDQLYVATKRPARLVKSEFLWGNLQKYTYRVLQTIQMKLIVLCVWAEPAVLGSAKTALKFKYKIQKGYYSYTIQCMGQDISLKSERKNP